MGKAALILRLIDNWLYNAGLSIALVFVLFGVMLCVTALPRSDAGARRSSRRLIEEGVLRED